jgi:hypothetical protein
MKCYNKLLPQCLKDSAAKITRTRHLLVSAFWKKTARGLQNVSHLAYEGLDCEILISAMNLQQALWEQGDKNYQNRDLKFKMWEEVAAECKCSCR